MIKRVVAMACVWALAATGAAQAGLLGAGITAYGGFNIPIAQDDTESGATYGLRAPLQMISALRVEPWFGFEKNGDYTLTTPISGETTLDGGEITSFGINGIFGSPMTAPGFSIAFVGGIGSHKFESEGLEADSRIGYNLGVDMGFGLGTTPLALSVRGEALVIPLDGGGSRKNGLVTAGLTFKFGM